MNGYYLFLCSTSHGSCKDQKKIYIQYYLFKTFIKLNKANINRCDSLSEMEQNQDLISTGSLVLVFFSLPPVFII